MTIKLAEFAIVDRLEYSKAFAGKIEILDSTIEEVRASREFLRALDMERKYLSALVEETITVQDGVLNTGLTRSFVSKAYALFRYVS